MRRPTKHLALALSLVLAQACASRVTVFESDVRTDDAADASTDAACPVSLTPYTPREVTTARVFSLGRHSRGGSTVLGGMIAPPNADIRVPRVALHTSSTELAPPPRWPAVVAIASSDGTVDLREEAGALDPSAALVTLAPVVITPPAVEGTVAVPTLEALEVRDGRYSLLFRRAPAANGTGLPDAWLAGAYGQEDLITPHSGLPNLTVVHEPMTTTDLGVTFIGPQRTDGSGPRRRVAYLSATPQTASGVLGLQGMRANFATLAPSYPSSSVSVRESGSLALSAALFASETHVWLATLEAWDGLPPRGMLASALAGETADPARVSVFQQEAGCAAIALDALAVETPGATGVAYLEHCQSSPDAFPTMRFSVLLRDASGARVAGGTATFPGVYTAAYVRPRVAFNGSEFAVIYAPVYHTGVALTVLTRDAAPLATYSMAMPRSPNLSTVAVDAVGDPASGDWVLAVQQNDEVLDPTPHEDSYLVRLGRCGTAPR